MYFHECTSKLKHHEKKESTIVSRACDQVNGFRTAYEKITRQVAISNQSKSTLACYSTRIATVCLHFGCMPELLDAEQLQDYLGKLAASQASPSRSGFKHLVHGLRFYFKLIGQSNRILELPSIRANKKLPTVLSKQECKLLFKTPRLIKHRLALCFIYSAGLRVSEFSNMKIGDVDFDRMMVHVRGGKGQKDRYVPLSKKIVSGLKNHLSAERPVKYLFEGMYRGAQYSVRAMQWVMREAIAKTGIRKENVCVHTLRHSYATHLLEDGVDIVTIKNLLGHSNIRTTMIYLHVKETSPGIVAHSPLDTLYS